MAIDRWRSLFRKETIETRPAVFTPEEQAVLALNKTNGNAGEDEIHLYLNICEWATEAEMPLEVSTEGSSLDRLLEITGELEERGYLETIDKRGWTVRRLTDLGKKVERDIRSQKGAFKGNVIVKVPRVI